MMGINCTVIEVKMRVRMKKIFQKTGGIAAFILMVLLFWTGNLSAQKYEHLEKLVNATEEMQFPEASENGRWLAWYIVSAGGTKKMMVQNVNDSKKTFERKNIVYFQFVKNNLVVQTGENLEFLNPETGKSQFLNGVSKFLYDRKHNVFVVLYNEEGGKKLEVFDTDLNLRQTLENVQYLFSNNGETILRKKTGNINEVYVLNKGNFTNVFSTTNEVKNIMTSATKERGIVIESESADQKLIHYITQDKKQFMLDVSGYRDYSLVAVGPSFTDHRIVIKLQKKVKSKTEMVSIWYGTDFDLAEHDGAIIKSVQLDWDIIRDEKTVMTRPGYFGETAIGNNLYLLYSVDKQQVDKMDKAGDKGIDELYLWNSSGNSYTKIADVDKQLVISPTGKYLVIQKAHKWQLYNTITLKMEDLDANEKMIPYFTSDTDILWVGGNRIARQDLNSKKITDLYRGTNVTIELIDFDKTSTELGFRRDFRKVDLSKSLVIQMTYASNDHVSYAYLKNRKLHVIHPPTGDGISELKKLGDKEDYFWVEENYNKRPRLVVKNGKSTPKVIYISDPANERFEQTELIRFSYKGSDGQNIKGNLFMPLNYDRTKKYPVVVHIYEKQDYLTKRFLRPSFANQTGYNIPLLMEDGFAVLLADISQSDKGAGISAVESIHNALDEMQNFKNIDMSKIGLIGQSFGGYQTNFIATHSNRFAAYVSGAAVSDVIRTYYAYNHHFKAPDYYRYEGRQYWFKDTVADNPEKYIRNNPIMSVQNVKAPMLLWTGTDDANVSPEGTKSMFIALRKYRKPVIALFYDKERHTMGRYETQKDLTVRILDWFNYHLKDQINIPWIQKYIKGAE